METTRFIVTMPKELHKEGKKTAVVMEMTLNELIVRAIEKFIKK